MSSCTNRFLGSPIFSNISLFGKPDRLITYSSPLRTISSALTSGFKRSRATSKSAISYSERARGFGFVRAFTRALVYKTNLENQAGPLRTRISIMRPNLVFCNLIHNQKDDMIQVVFPRIKCTHSPVKLKYNFIYPQCSIIIEI